MIILAWLLVTLCSLGIGGTGIWFWLEGERDIATITALLLMLYIWMVLNCPIPRRRQQVECCWCGAKECDCHERINCSSAGKIGHQGCGWCAQHSKPNFLCRHQHQVSRGK